MTIRRSFLFLPLLPIIFLLLACDSTPSGPSYGDTCWIDPEGKETALLAIDEKAYDDMIRTSIPEEDIKARTFLAMSGKLFFVKRGTQVRAYDSHMYSAAGPQARKVWILEGEHKDKYGWVSADFLKR